MPFLRSGDELFPDNFLMMDELINMLDERPWPPAMAQELAYRILQRSNSRDAAVERVLEAYSQKALGSRSLDAVRTQIHNGMNARDVDVTYRLATDILNPADLDGYGLEYFIAYAEQLGVSEHEFEQLFEDIRIHFSTT